METVSRVLNGKYKGRTKNSRAMMKRILKEADRVNYRPNNAARAMRTQNTGLIGVVIEEGNLKTHPVFTEVLQGANQILKDAGYVLTVSSLDGIEESTLESRIFKEKLLDGLMIFDSSNEKSVKEMLKVVPNSVLVNTNTWLPTCCVRRDENAAGFLAGKKLKELGYKKAFYFESDIRDYDFKLHHYSVSGRLKGLLEGFSGRGLEVNVLKIGTGDIMNWLHESRHSLTPDSVLVASHNLRLFCLTASLSQMDLKVGSDFGLASLDDETGLWASFPHVSRVSFPRIQIGEVAARMMINLLAGKKESCQSFEIKGEWFQGNTTRKIL